MIGSLEAGTRAALETDPGRARERIRSHVNEQGHTPIFFDASRRRWGRFNALMVTLTTLCVIGGIGFAGTLLWGLTLPALSIANALGFTDPAAHAARHTARLSASALPAADAHARAKNHYVIRKNVPVQEAKRKLTAAIQREEAPRPIPAATTMPGRVQGPVRAVFYVNYDKPSLDSLTHHINEITHLCPAWLFLKPTGKTIAYDDSDNPPVAVSLSHYVGPNEPDLSDDTAAPSNDSVALQYAHRAGVAILPVVQNAGEDDFHPEWLHKLLASPANRAAVIAQLLAFTKQGHFQGVNIDFETDHAEDRQNLLLFMTELASAFHPLGLLVTQDVQTDSDAYNLPALAKTDDFLVPMLYDQHGGGTHAGPIAGQDWYMHELAGFMAQVPASRVVLGLSNYAYDWADGTTAINEYSFEDAARIAEQSKASGDGDDGIIAMDKASLNPTFSYYDDGPNGKALHHTVWLMDATTTWNDLQSAASYHTLGAALWRLGEEDPSLWSFFGKASANGLAAFDPQTLKDITYNYFGTQFEGYGEILDVVQHPTPGLRTITTDSKTHLITGEKFLKYPTQYVIRRTGLVNQQDGPDAGKNDGPQFRKIALTFDDGPDPRWTPQILDILHRYHVPATFFVVGGNAEAHPGLVAREWNEGMEIGNHSFTHPEELTSPLRTKLELDATQRVIEAITGHMTTLFRAPNRADAEPSSPSDFEPILQADDLGYLFVGELDDPTDWKPGTTADEIVQHVLGYVDDPAKNDGNTILLHDAGGTTREQTILALPRIIEGLKQRGYTFVPVSALVGKPKSQIFPAVTGHQLWTVAFDRAFFDLTYWTGNGFTALFLLAIGLGISRIVIMGTLAAKQAKREAARTFAAGYQPTVSVIIAAYNEAKVINKTIATILSSDYPDIDILVVDDGSKDNTSEVVRAVYGDHPRITIIRKENGGKASALNLGIKQCRGEIIVALDADTVFAPDTIAKLVRHFYDPAVGAVSGNVKVGNRSNPLTIWQAVEYITSQNFDRRAFDLLNCITVVPGAVGAWRKDAVILAGLYSSQTLAEDTDLTFKIQRLGYRILTDNAALAYTEAPDTIRDLAKQRFRWAFGTLQCLWKHRSVLFNPRYGAFGTVAMPSLWVFQIGFQAIAPVVDLMILWSIIYSRLILTGTDQKSSFLLLGYWAVFSSVELAGAYLAFRLDKEDKKLLGWLLLQRFVYRQLMYYVIVKSLVVAARGSLVGWGKLDRKGTVQMATPHAAAPKPAPSQPANRDGPDKPGTIAAQD